MEVCTPQGGELAGNGIQTSQRWGGESVGNWNPDLPKMRAMKTVEMPSQAFVQSTEDADLSV